MAPKGQSQGLARKIHRQAANSLQQLIAADGAKKGGASIKNLTFQPSIHAKKATYALTCETLKYLPVLRDVLGTTDLLGAKPKLRPELAYVLAYDLLLGEGLEPTGDAERLVLSRKSTLRAELARLMVKRQVATPEDLLPPEVRGSGVVIPRYVRVNTLKLSVDDALSALQAAPATHQAARDDLLPDLLLLPPGTDLHDHPLVADGSLVLQGKSSCMPAHVLSPDATWQVIDACAAPGNKTTHVSALMRGAGRVIACDADLARVARLRATVAKAGATNVEVRHQDFLALDPSSPDLAKVRAVLLDPSCSGSGTKAQRLDRLLPSSSSAQSMEDAAAEEDRIERLARFQETALLHALSFPGVERVVYSTCSVHRRENEDVVAAVLPFAESRGLALAKALPSWPHRGLPVLDGAELLVRVDAERDKTDGFFIALFQRAKRISNGRGSEKGERQSEVASAPPKDASKRGEEAVVASAAVSGEARKNSKKRKRRKKGGHGDGEESLKQPEENGEKGLGGEAGRSVDRGTEELDVGGGSECGVLRDGEMLTVLTAQESRLRRRRLKRIRRKERKAPPC